jgi:hypothetical protein
MSIVVRYPPSNVSKQQYDARPLRTRLRILAPLHPQAVDT